MSERLQPAAAMLTGKCLCGATEYQVADSFEYAMNCHCSKCRRTTGSAFKPIAGIKRGLLHCVPAQDSVLIYGAADGPHDVHCATCGSFLWSVVRDGGYVHIAMGTLVDEPGIRPSMHIFVGSKAKWHDIKDDLPQFYGFPDR